MMTREGIQTAPEFASDFFLFLFVWVCVVRVCFRGGDMSQSFDMPMMGRKKSDWPSPQRMRRRTNRWSKREERADRSVLGLICIVASVLERQRRSSHPAFASGLDRDLDGFLCWC